MATVDYALIICPESFVTNDTEHLYAYIEHEGWQIRICPDIKALTDGPVKTDGIPYLKGIQTSKSLPMRYTKLTFEPPGIAVRPSAQTFEWLTVPSFWENDTAAAFCVAIIQKVVDNPVLRAMGYDHHRLHDMAQDISVGLSLLVNSDWINEQTHWGQQYLLRQLLLGEDE